MGKYSQNNEDELIKNFFSGQEESGKNLTLLSIGENDGKTLSNALWCIERGWLATLVEPSTKCFEKLTTLHKDNGKICCIKNAVSDKKGTVTFYESREHAKHMYGENHSLLSSLNKEQVDIWGKDNEFDETECEAITFNELLEKSKHKTFDLITVDCEGYDFIIVKQMDLNALGCQMLIVESNTLTNKDEESLFLQYCNSQGFILHAKTRENLIMVK